MTPTVTEILAPHIQFYDRTDSAVSWYWDFGDSTFDTIPNPSHNYKDTGSYNVCLTITNPYGCTSTACSTVVVKPIFTFYVPNAFSPDGDGKNDTFSGYGFGVSQLEMFIFDRWGDMVFHTKDIEIPWDGKINNGSDIAQEDVYVYLIVVKDVLGGKTKYIGNVTVVR
jgi:gliding motility-associated-like protein